MNHRITIPTLCYFSQLFLCFSYRNLTAKSTTLLNRSFQLRIFDPESLRVV